MRRLGRTPQGQASARPLPTVLNVVEGKTYDDLLRAHYADEDRMAARGYFVVRTHFRPLSPWQRLGLQLRHGPFAEPGGRLEIEYLARPDVQRPEAPAPPPLAP